MSQFRFPRKDLIGREIVMNVSGDMPGAAYFADRRQGYRTRITDAGNMTGGPVIWIHCESGIGFSTDQYDDYEVV